MKIWYDDIIYSLQKAGGISVMWSHITDQSIFSVYHIRYEGVEDNLFSETLDGHFYHVLDSSQFILKRYMNRTLKVENTPLNNYSGSENVNTGTGKELTIKQLTELAAKVIGYEGKIRWDTTKPNGTPRKLLDVSKAWLDL